ncbi:hypothetical protein E2562_032179 [Oryza meyeriana var. granulata]|uniref:Uncharacterized protein n=1 Tax=Oryza meyeriana var. granulata TaxID=110450 RepID=A0A6G1F0C5_9ORYZ|nr:hypothetical protein E2562_032179 [Oryza meyeriana var. granulata]
MDEREARVRSSLLCVCNRIRHQQTAWGLVGSATTWLQQRDRSAVDEQDRKARLSLLRIHSQIRHR